MDDHVCIMDLLPSYLDSDSEKYGISIEEWEETQTICTYCSDQQGKPLCPGGSTK